MDSISDSAYCLDFERSTDFFAEILDMCIDRTIIDILIVADDILHERVALDDSFTIFHEVFEE
jgi:hypothetical protein